MLICLYARTEAIIQMKKLHNQQPQEMLQKAILNNSAIEVRNAVQAGADINNGKDGKSPLIWALLLQRQEAFAELIRLGSNVHVTYEGVSLVLHALKLDDLKSALLLLNNGANCSGSIGIDAIKLICCCVRSCKSDNATILEFVQDLIKLGCAPNEFWANGDLYLRRNLSSEIIKLIIKNGANPNYRLSCFPNGYYNPLYSAIANSNIEATKALLEAGADANQKICMPNQSEKSLLAIAIERGNKEIVEMLLAHGANL